jgi:hypothetical protein
MTARKRAEEIAYVLIKRIMNNQVNYPELVDDTTCIADTLEPLLEEIEAARVYTDSIHANSTTGEIGLHIGFKQHYDAIRKRNEAGERNHDPRTPT